MKIPFSTDELSQLPIEKAETIPSTWYTDEDIFHFELEHLFTSFWQLVGHHSEITSDSPCFIEIAGNPLILVRDQQDGINAFYNVCRHRGGPLELKSGTTSVLQCLYHGWTYLLDGSLRGVPSFDRVELFNKKDFGLSRVELENWNGFVFTILSNPQNNLNTMLQGVSDRIKPIDLSNFSYYTEQSYLIKCNWKIYIDNYLEGYHLPIVHPELNKMLDYKNYVTETEQWYSLQYSPIRDGDNMYESDEGQAFYYFIFPNMMLNILPGRLQTNMVRPITTDKTEVIFKYYYSDTESKSSRNRISKDIASSHKIQLEDIEICESVQKGIQSRAYDKGRFSVERELGVYHFQTLLKDQFRHIANR